MSLVPKKTDETVPFFVLKSGQWEEYKSIFKVEAKATEWAFERIREALKKVAKEEAGRLSIVQRIMLKYRLLAAHRCASTRTRMCHDVVSAHKLQQFSPGRLRVMGFSWQETQQLVMRDLRRKMIGRRNRLLVVQTGDSASQAKVFQSALGTERSL